MNNIHILESHNPINVKYERSQFIDLLRGIAIILMIIGHCIEIGSGANYYNAEDFYYNRMHNIIYSFHMPLFAIISGYVFYWSNNKSLKETIKKKLLSLVLPMIFWTLLDVMFTCSYTIIYESKSINVLSFIIYGVKIFLFHYWFLWTVFFCSVIVAIIEKIYNKHNPHFMIITYIIIVLLTYFLPNKYFAKHYFMLPFFIMGYLINKTKIINIIKDWNRKVKIVLCFALTILFIITVQQYNKSTYVYISGTSIIPFFSPGYSVGEHILINIYRIWIGLSGSIIAFLLLKAITAIKPIQNSIILKTISWVGANSMGIYITSLYCNDSVRLITRNFRPNFLYWICESIIVLILCSLSVIFIKKFKILSFILLGRRN